MLFIEFEIEELENLNFNHKDYSYLREQNAKDELPMKRVELSAEIKYIDKLLKNDNQLFR
jgi:hypothetical protein